MSTRAEQGWSECVLYDCETLNDVIAGMRELALEGATQIAVEAEDLEGGYVRLSYQRPTDCSLNEWMIRMQRIEAHRHRHNGWIA